MLNCQRAKPKSSSNVNFSQGATSRRLEPSQTIKNARVIRQGSQRGEALASGKTRKIPEKFPRGSRGRSLLAQRIFLFCLTRSFRSSTHRFAIENQTDTVLQCLVCQVISLALNLQCLVCQVVSRSLVIRTFRLLPSLRVSSGVPGVPSNFHSTCRSVLRGLGELLFQFWHFHFVSRVPMAFFGTLKIPSSLTPLLLTDLFKAANIANVPRIFTNILFTSHWRQLHSSVL